MIGTVYAQTPLDTVYTPGDALGGVNATVGTLLSPILSNVIIFSGIFAFFVIIFAGFTYITGGGDKGKIAQASNMLSYGILGLVLVVAAYLITRIIGTLVGFDFLNQGI